MKTMILSFAVMILLSTSSVLTDAKANQPSLAPKVGANLGSYCTLHIECESKCCLDNHCSGECKSTFFKVSQS
jgi:hypothetical protein